MTFQSASKPSIRVGRVVAALLGTCSGGALAQQAAPEREAEALQEIVITARQVEERLQDVPLTVTAFTATDMARRGVNELEDIARLTPGFSFEDFATSFNAAPIIRGLNQADVQSPAQNVPTYIDGVYIQRNYAIDIGGADVQRIEIVKGPQSALYGQNAFAGAINYVFARPTDELEGLATVTYGNAGREEARIAVGGPLLDGKLGARVGYAFSRNDGTWDNGMPGVSDRYAEVGGRESRNLSASIVFTPTDALDLELSYVKGEREADVAGSWNVAANDPQNRLNCGPTVLVSGMANSPRYICGELNTNPLAYASAASTRPAGILQTETPATEAEMDLITARLNWKIAEGLAANYLFGRVDAEAQERSSQAVNPVTPSNLPPFGATNQVQKQGGVNSLTSHELRLDWTPQGALSARLGVYHSDVEDDFRFANRRIAPLTRFDDGGAGPLDTTGFTTILRNTRLEDITRAIFGQFSYAFADGRAKVSAEARYQEQERTFVDNLSAFTQSGTFTAVTPRFTGEYRLAPDNLLYVSAAKGTKAGGFNGRQVGTGATATILLPEEQIYDEESNWTYEIGSKNAFFGGDLVLNASLFYVDWKDLQIQSVPTNAVIVGNQAPPVIFLNLGAATSYGLELDGSWRATDALSLNFALSLFEPTYKDGTKSRRFAGTVNCDDVICASDGEVGGKTQARVSPFSATVGFNWSADFSERVGWYVRGDLSHQSKQYLEEMNLGWIGARTLTNASIGLTGENWEAQLWGKNLTDEEYLTSSLFIIQFGSYTPALGERRTAGLSLTWRF
jgi:iron complex outermembrane recepter protein